MAKKKTGRNLATYWERGAGAAKVRWGSGGDFSRCVSHLRKYVRDPKAYCALRHKRATGIWPQQHAAKMRRRKARR